MAIRLGLHRNRALSESHQQPGTVQRQPSRAQTARFLLSPALRAPSSPAHSARTWSYMASSASHALAGRPAAPLVDGICPDGRLKVFSYLSESHTSENLGAWLWGKGEAMGLRLAAAVSLTFGVGCAAMMNGSTQPVTFRSAPSGASVVVNGNLVGSTPSTIKLKRRVDHHVIFEKEGYQEQEVHVKSHYSGSAVGWSIVGALVWWGPFEYLLDFPMGSLKELSSDSVRVRLESDGSHRDAAAGRRRIRSRRSEGSSRTSPDTRRRCTRDAAGRCMTLEHMRSRIPTSTR